MFQTLHADSWKRKLQIDLKFFYCCYTGSCIKFKKLLSNTFFQGVYHSKAEDIWLFQDLSLKDSETYLVLESLWEKKECQIPELSLLFLAAF